MPEKLIAKPAFFYQLFWLPNCLIYKSDLLTPQKKPSRKERLHIVPQSKNLDLFYRINNGFESLWLVHCKVGKDFAVDFNICFRQFANKFRI